MISYPKITRSHSKMEMEDILKRIEIMESDAKRRSKSI
jgi:hypothetical protein